MRWLVVRFLLGGIFLAAAAAKLAGWWWTGAQPPAWLTAAVWLEGLLALAWLLSPWSRLLRWPTLLVCVAFAIYQFGLIWQGEDCACFGPWSPPPPVMLAIDLLLVAALALVRPPAPGSGRAGAGGDWRGFLIAALLGSVALGAVVLGGWRAQRDLLPPWTEVGNAEAAPLTPRWSWQPGTGIDLGYVVPGASVEGVVAWESQAGAARIEALRSDCACIVAQALPTANHLALRFDAPTTVGPYRRIILVTWSDGRTENVPALARVGHPLRSEPSFLKLPEAWVGEAIESDILIYNDADVPIRALMATGSAGLHASGTPAVIAAGGSLRLRVVATPEQEGEQPARLQIHTDHAEQAVVSVPVMIHGRL